MLMAWLLPGLLPMVLCPKLQVNSLSWGCEDQEELVGTSLLPSVSNSRGMEPLEGGEELAVLRTLLGLGSKLSEVSSNQNSLILTHELSMLSSSTFPGHPRAWTASPWVSPVLAGPCHSEPASSQQRDY